MRIKSIVRNFFLHKKYKQLNDAFNIHSHLTLDERITLYKLAKDKINLLEIGSYVGASSACLVQPLVEQSKGRLICIDTWNNDAMTEGFKDTYLEFQHNISDVKDFIFPVRGFSTEVVDKVEAETDSLDLVFIDGDHSYEGVKADWETYKHLLKPGSVVIFHDWGWAEGVKQVIAEDVTPIVENIDYLPNMWWAQIKSTSC